MTLNEKITQLLDGILNEEEKRVLDDFVDNYVGTNEEGYIPNKDYKEQNKDCLKPIWRKMKEANIFGPFVKLLRPHINQGLFDLFLSEDVYI
jgi:hypothetical protein